MTYVGHATVLVQVDGTTVVTDPVLRRRVAHLRRHAEFDPDTLPAVDAVLISHLHGDHLDVASIRRIGRDVSVLVPRGAGAFLRRKGFTATELAPGETTSVGGLEVEAVHAEHHGKRMPFGPDAPSLGYVLSGGGRRVYFAGDTELFAGMAEIGSRRLDLALLPVAGWGPRLGPGHMDATQAAEAAALLRPAVAVPIHWGTYSAMGTDSLWGDAPAAFAERVSQTAPGVRVEVLAPGASLAL